MQDTDTIAAIATAPGRGGVGIVRLSGPDAAAIGEAIAPPLPPPRHAAYRRFLDVQGQEIDQGLVLYFPAPGTYTGEPVVELQGHGGPVVLDMLLNAALLRGARLARPGEFTQRAFLNDRMDLAQAEAVADLIDAGSSTAARAALRSLEGDFSRAINAIVDALTELRVYVEASIDFIDEDIDFLAAPELERRVTELQRRFTDLQQQATQGAMLREGITVVIAGPPNAGKSSLLNRIAGRDAAIVTDIAGTTRDVLREHITLDGLPIHVLDTAGLRDTGDQIEREGVRRAMAEIANADLLLLVEDAANPARDIPALPEAAHTLPIIRVRNKIDLTGEPADRHGNLLPLSAKTGAGVEALCAYIKESVAFNPAPEGALIARRRHLDALERAHHSLQAGLSQLEAGAPELFAEDLRLAQSALGEITGKVTADDLLGQIFASFCIGK